MFEIAAVSLAVKNSESVKLTLSGKSFRVQLFSESSAVTAKCNAEQEQKRNSIMKMFMWNCGPRYIYRVCCKVESQAGGDTKVTNWTQSDPTEWIA